MIERRIADAEKELDAVRATIPGNEAGKGFLKGLEGLLLTAKSNDDKYLYLAKIDKTPKKLKELRKEFTSHSKGNLHSDYDKGYFLSLESYVKRLERSNVPQEVAAEDKKAKPSA